MQQDLLYHISRNLKTIIYQDRDELAEVKKLAAIHNPWFESLEIDRMLDMVFTKYLDEVNLTKWLSNYIFNKFHPNKVVGIVAAGNIPLASFQDVWCALACGFAIQLKLSSKDEIVSTYLYEKINLLIPNSIPKIAFVNKVSNIDALIASGSNLTANHFKKYIHRFPCLVRAHRNGIAILSGSETEQELIAFGNDLFSYYGLGCRSVTKIYIPDKSMIATIAKVFDDHFTYVRDNYKYTNNYQYQLALLSLNRNTFYQCDCIYFNESKSLNSSIAVVNYEIYKSLADLETELKTKLNSIQCICTNIDGLSLKTSCLGNAQLPELWDYQDDIDIVRFLQTAL